MTPKSITFRVTPTNSRLRARKPGGYVYRETLRKIIGAKRKIPDKPYEVTWKIDPDGDIRLDRDGDIPDVGCWLCIFPYNWRNVHLRRKVRVL